MSPFIEFVAYKAQRVGKRVIHINEAYTTQIGIQYGYQEKRPPSQRHIAYHNCGLLLERDLNAAVNLLTKFYLLKPQWDDLLHKPSVNEESLLL